VPRVLRYVNPAGNKDLHYLNQVQFASVGHVDCSVVCAGGLEFNSTTG